MPCKVFIDVLAVTLLEFSNCINQKIDNCTTLLAATVGDGAVDVCFVNFSGSSSAFPGSHATAGHGRLHFVFGHGTRSCWNVIWK